MIYLAKAVHKETGKEVSDLYIKNKKTDIAAINEKYELTVLNESGAVLANYNIKNLYGAYVIHIPQQGSFIHLITINEDYWMLYNYLHCIDERHKEQMYLYKGDCCYGRNIGFEMRDSRYYFFFDSNGSWTLGDILMKRTCWSIDNDILIIHGACYDTLYKIEDVIKFRRVLAKLKVFR